MAIQSADIVLSPKSEINNSPHESKAISNASLTSPEKTLLDRIDLGIREDQDPADILADIAHSGEENPSNKRILGLKSREDLSGWMQRMRQKKNVMYEPADGEPFFAKYVTKSRDERLRDTVSGIKREKRLLDKLADTGVVPKAGDLKLYPDEHNPQKGRLLMERVEGKSLDNQENDFIKDHASETITSTAQALQTVHEAGVAVVDINPGTFVMSDQESGISTKIVDLELACDLYNPIPSELQEAHNWYRNKDLGYRMAKIENANSTSIRKAEIHLWAKTIVEKLLGPSYTWEDVELSSEGQARYQESCGFVEPTLREEAIKKAKKDYTRIVENGPPWPGGEEAYIKSSLEQDMRLNLLDETIDATLADRLKAKGIQLPHEVVDFMSRALSNKLEVRPADFNEILRKGGEQLVSA